MKFITKQILLFGAFAMLLSTVPMQAIENAPANVQAEVSTKRGFFAGWSRDAINNRLKNAMNELDKLWKKYMKCIKGDKGCSRSLVWSIRGITLTILALVTIGGRVGISRRRAAKQQTERERLRAKREAEDRDLRAEENVERQSTRYLRYQRRRAFEEQQQQAERAERAAAAEARELEVPITGIIKE